MTVRKDITNQLKELKIYNWLDEKRKWDVFIKIWFYVSKEILEWITHNKEIETYSNNLDIFRSKVIKTRQTVRNNIEKWEYIYLLDGYYDKVELSKYLFSKI